MNFASGNKVSRMWLMVIIIVVILCGLQLYRESYYSESKSCLPTTNAIDWRTVDVEQLTSAQMFEYLLWPNRTACQLVHDFGGVMFHKPSGLDGQKAICLDSFIAPPEKDCLVYSFGINNEWSFDEAMESYGCQVYAFDPSMKAKDHDHTPKIHFFKLGLSGENTNDENGWRLSTLSSIFNMLKSRHGDRVIDYLKIDIEYGEWSAIPEIVRSGMLSKVRQMGIEIHLPLIHLETELKNYVSIVRSIEASGMVRFDSKRNPWFNGYILDFDVSRGYEIAWYNNKFTNNSS